MVLACIQTHKKGLCIPVPEPKELIAAIPLWYIHIITSLLLSGFYAVVQVDYNSRNVYKPYCSTFAVQSLRSSDFFLIT